MANEHKENGEPCKTCAHRLPFGNDSICSVVPDFIYEDVSRNSVACEEYREITEFEEWLIRVMRAFEKRESRCIEDGKDAEAEKNYKIKEVVEDILYKYQEILESEK